VNSTTMLMILGMAVVTYTPRMLPLVVLNGKKMNPFLQGVLKNVPFAALGALIFPGVLFIQDDIWFGIIGALAAFAASYLGVNVIFVVLSSIVILTIYSWVV
jgi:branched-subunit amino acid transport protein